MIHTFDTTVTVKESRMVTIYLDAVTNEELVSTGWVCNHCWSVMLAPAIWSDADINDDELVASLHEPSCTDTPESIAERRGW